MPILEAIQIMEEKAGGTWRITTAPLGYYCFRTEGYNKPYGIYANKYKKVNMFVFDGPMVDDLFNSQELSAYDFADQFCTAYKISKMTNFIDVHGWEYISPHGYKITISESKELIVEHLEAKKPNSRPSLEAKKPNSRPSFD